MLSPDDEVHINAGVDSEVSDLLDHRRWAVDVGDSLVDAHLVAVKSFGTISARRSTSCHIEYLGGDANDAASIVALLLGSADDLSASCNIKILL
jgi:hypothetical protein